MRSFSASSASLTAIRPPSPSAKRFFVGKKLNVEAMLVAMPLGAERLRRVLDHRQAEAAEVRRAGGRRGAPA